MPPDALPPDWMNLLLAYGPLGVLALLVLYFVVKYGPRIIEGHLSLTRTCETTQERIAGALETMSEGQGSSDKNHSKTHRALAHIAAAHREASTCPDVQRELDKATDVLRAP